MECSQARRFVRTLFQILMRQSQKLADQPVAAEPGASAPLKEDMDYFIARMQQSQSLELLEMTGRISGAATRASDNVASAGGTAMAMSNLSEPLKGPMASSLLEAAQRLAADAEKVGEHIVEALSSHVSILACVPVHAPSPFNNVGLPELKAAAMSDFAAGVPSPRGLGGSTLSMNWESLGEGLGVRLVLLWSGGGALGAELHICHVGLTPAPPGATPPVKLEYAHIHAGKDTAVSDAAGSRGGGPAAHFVLCQMYDSSHAAALILQEDPAAPGGAVATVCLVDVSSLALHTVPRLGSAIGDTGEEQHRQTQLPAAIALESLPEGALRRSVALPESYAWSSAMRCMSTRGVCSVYARRARRLLTLDMDGEADDEEDADEDIAE